MKEAISVILILIALGLAWMIYSETQTASDRISQSMKSYASYRDTLEVSNRELRAKIEALADTISERSKRLDSLYTNFEKRQKQNSYYFNQYQKQLTELKTTLDETKKQYRSLSDSAIINLILHSQRPGR